MGLFSDSLGFKYIVTEFMSLGSLDLLLRQNMTLGLEVLLDMGSQICLGMTYLEKKNLIHR
jgi:serine/threonine protein kinase